MLNAICVNCKSYYTVHFNFCLKLSSSLEMSHTFSGDTTKLLGTPGCCRPQQLSDLVL